MFRHAMVRTPLWRKLSRRFKILVVLLALLALGLSVPAGQALRQELSRPDQIVAFERPLADFLRQACPNSRIHVLETSPLRIVGTVNCSPERRDELEGLLRELCPIDANRGDSLILIPGHVPTAWNARSRILLVLLLGLVPALFALQQLACWLLQVAVPGLRFSPAVALAGVACLGWPLWTLIPSLLILLILLPRPRSIVIKNGLEEAAILLTSMTPELTYQSLTRLGTEAAHEITKVLSRLPPLSPAQRAQVQACFVHHLELTRQRLGSPKAGSPDADLVARTLREFYLPVAPQKSPTSVADMTSSDRVTIRPLSRTRRKIFSCPVCDEVFIDEDSLRNHERVAHDPARRKIFRCPACDEVFIDEQSLLRHQAALHRTRKFRKKPLVWLAVCLIPPVLLALARPQFQQINLPNARPNPQATERLAEVARLVNLDSVVAVQGPTLTVFGVRGNIDDLQSLLESVGIHQNAVRLMRLPAVHSKAWGWLPLALCLGWLARTAIPRRSPVEATPTPLPPVEKPPEEKLESLASLMQVDVLSVELGRNLLCLIDPNHGQKLVERVTSIQRHMALELGLLVPGVKFYDNLSLAPYDYTIRINDCVVARGTAQVNQFLAIGPDHKLESLPGEVTLDPTYQMPGKWIAPHYRGNAERLGCMIFDPVSVVAVQLTEMVRRHASQILSVAEVIRRLEDDSVCLMARELATRGADAIVIWKVLRGLLRECVSIRDLTTILEAIAEQVHLTQDPEYLIEFARMALGLAICDDLADSQKVLNVITLDPELEKVVAETELNVQLGAEAYKAIADQIKKMQEQGLTTIVLTPPTIRARLHNLLSPGYPHLKVLSWNEIAAPYHQKVNSVAMARL